MQTHKILLTAAIVLSACSPDPIDTADEALLGFGRPPVIDVAQISRLNFDGHWWIQAGIHDDGKIVAVTAKIDQRAPQNVPDNFFAGYLLDLGDWTVLGLGTHTCTLRAVDDSGLSATKVIVFQVVPPTTAPVVTELNAGVSPELPLHGWAYAHAQDVDGDLVRLELELDGNGSWIVVEQSSTPVGQLSTYHELTGLTIGTHTARARAIDAGGRVSALAGPYTFEWLDPTAPTCTADRIVIDPAEGAYVIQGTVHDDNANLNELLISFDSGDWRFRGAFYEPRKDLPYSARIWESTPGVHTVTAQVVDSGGLTGTCGPLTYTAKAAPRIAAFSVSVLPFRRVRVTGTASDADADLKRVEVRFDDDGGWSAATGAGSFTYTRANVAAGTHHLAVRAVDALGLRSEETWSGDVVVN